MLETSFQSAITISVSLRRCVALRKFMALPPEWAQLSITASRPRPVDPRRSSNSNSNIN